jgi:hypothetical protein
MRKKREYLPDGRVETYVYFICDKVGCEKQNNRKIYRYDRSLQTGALPIIHTEEICAYCGKGIHEPDLIEVDPF